MKVVVITHNYIRRQGDLTALYLHRLSSGLVDQGMAVTVVCPHAPGLLKTDVIDGVKIIRFKYPFWRKRPIVYTGNMHQEVAGSLAAKLVFAGFMRSFYRSGLKICRDEKTDLIWANWWIPPGLAAARIAAKLKLPLIVSSHGTDLSLLGKNSLINLMAEKVYRRASRATVVSSFLKNKLIDQVEGIGRERVSIISMPVGMEYFPKSEPPRNSRPVFLSVARYTGQKHLTDIIEAASKVKADGYDFKIVMVGEGPLEKQLRDTVTRKGLNDQIEFIPLLAQEKLGEFYADSDAVVLVSEGEGFGLVLVEAAFVGRPAIAARSGGIIDIVEDGKNGLMVDPGNADQIAAAMKKFITDPEFRLELGERAYQMALRRFATPVLVKKMHDVFSDVTGSEEKR